jgi:raffinose/stachyose/melibiose transport system permease protein
MADLKNEKPVIGRPLFKPQGKQFRVSAIIILFCLSVFALLFILPLVLPLFFVFKEPLDFNADPWGWPKKFVLTNFEEAWNQLHLLEALLNSLIVCAGAIVFTVPLAAMAGYIFSRYRDRVIDVLFYLVMAGFFIPAQMILIPLARTEKAIGILNTLPAVFFPLAAFGIPFWTMIYRSFYRTLPSDLIEAARIDGSGHWRTFVQIIWPLAKPATVLAVLLTFFGAWNDYLLALIFINKSQWYTIQLRVAQLMNQFGANYFPEYSAGLVIALVPSVLLYIVLHRQIMEGTTLSGAIKG